MNSARPLRERKKLATRQKILEEAASLLVSEDASALSVPAIAQRSGISVRTVYRYFPNKSALVAALGEVEDPATTAGPMPSLDGSDLHAWLRRGWSEEVQTPLLRAQLRTAAGVEVRRDRRARHRAFAFAVLDEWSIELSPESRRSVADVLLLLTGGAALAELTDVLGLSVDQASAAAAWAVEAVLTHALLTGEVPDGSSEFQMRKPNERT